jgi:hypothetical protein
MIFRKINQLIFFFFIILILYYFYPTIIYRYFILPIQKGNEIYLFGDWSVIISAIKCKLLDYNVFLNNPCDVVGRKHVYGSVLLFIPYFEKYDTFYFIYFPFIINIIFILSIIFHFKLSSLKEYFLCLVFIFNPSTLLLMERLNFDIFIFLSLIILCYFRNNILNLIFTSFLTLAKFYPLIFFPLFFFHSKIKKIFTGFYYGLFFIVLVAFVLYLDSYNLIEIFKNTKQFSAQYKWSFNFLSLSKIPLLLNIFSKNFLILFIIIFSFIFIYVGFIICRKVLLKKNYILICSWNYNETLFLLSMGVLVFTYFAFNNWIYREIFLFGLIPLLLDLSKNDLFFKKFINFIIFRMLFFILSSYFAIFLRNDLLLIFNQIIDLCFISFLLGSLICLYFKILVYFFNLKKII